MKNRQHTQYKPRKFWYQWIALCVLIFFLPLLGMIINPDEVYWTILDFAAAGALFISLGICIDQIQRRVNSKRLKWFAIAASLLGMTILWLELAVGIF